ncbi:MAG: hypothetical protein II282_04985 [Alistipes sp.]|nr:hypothetical protein [Alistipes sp.]
MVTIKDTTKIVPFDFEEGAFKGNGEARVNQDGTIQQINGTIYNEEGAYAGNFSAHSAERGELKYNLSGVTVENLATVAEVVNAVVADFKLQIN